LGENFKKPFLKKNGATFLKARFKKGFPCLKRVVGLELKPLPPEGLKKELLPLGLKFGEGLIKTWVFSLPFQNYGPKLGN